MGIYQWQACRQAAGLHGLLPLKAFSSVERRSIHEHQQLRPLQPSAHDDLERLLAASNQVMAATQLVKGHPHQSGPIQACNMAEDVFQAAHLALVEAVAEPEAGWGEANVPALLDELLVADNQARFARGLFNDATEAYNESIQMWPTRVLARLMGFHPAASPFATVSMIRRFAWCGTTRSMSAAVSPAFATAARAVEARVRVAKR